MSASHGTRSSKAAKAPHRADPTGRTDSTQAIQRAVNVKSLGARGDGTTDDTAAFVQTIAAQDKIFVPKGDFRLAGTLQLRAIRAIPTRLPPGHPPFPVLAARATLPSHASI